MAAARKIKQPPLFDTAQIDALFRAAPAPSDELFPDEAQAQAQAAPPAPAATIHCTVCTQRNAQARPGVQVCVLCAADVGAARGQLAHRREILTQRYDASLAAWQAAYSAASDDTRARYDRLDAARRGAGLWPDLRPMDTPTPREQRIHRWQQVVATHYQAGEPLPRPVPEMPAHVDVDLVRRSVAAAVAKGDALSALLVAETKHAADVADCEHLRAGVEAAEREIDALVEEV